MESKEEQKEIPFAFRISVVIPTHGRKAMLEETLNSLSRCIIPPTFNELVVVENGSKMGAEEIVSRLPERLNSRYMHVEVPNKSNALNKALDTIDDGLIFFTDDDAKFSPNVLTAYASAARDHSRGTFFGGPVNVEREKEPIDWIETLLPFSATGYDLINNRMESGYLGINWAAFLSDIKELGGFDEKYGPGSPTGAIGQESDMQRRMRAAGMKGVDVSEAIVWHKVPMSRCNEKWLKRRFYKKGISNGLRNHTIINIFYELFQLIKYSMRYFIYLLLFNKNQRKKSKILFAKPLGFFYGLIRK